MLCTPNSSNLLAANIHPSPSSLSVPLRISYHHYYQWVLPPPLVSATFHFLTPFSINYAPSSAILVVNSLRNHAVTPSSSPSLLLILSSVTHYAYNSIVCVRTLSGDIMRDAIQLLPYQPIAHLIKDHLGQAG